MIYFDSFRLAATTYTEMDEFATINGFPKKYLTKDEKFAHYVLETAKGPSFVGLLYRMASPWKKKPNKAKKIKGVKKIPTAKKVGNAEFWTICHAMNLRHKENESKG